MMHDSERRRQRLARVLELAQTYRGWTRKELARALRRDPTKLIPGSGIPKLDIVVDLAKVLDWGIEDVVAAFWMEENDEPGAATGDFDFESIDCAMREAHREGRYEMMIDLARTAQQRAQDAEERARACNREAGGWDGLGRYKNVLRAIQRGLSETPVSSEFRRMLQSNLANAYYSLWSLVEARAIASDLIAWYRDHRAVSLRDRQTNAFAHYVAGQTHRRLMSADPGCAEHCASQARTHLVSAIERYRTLEEETTDGAFAGISNTCYGGLIETDVMLRRRDPGDALRELQEGLDDLDVTADSIAGDRLESYGWWCIFGCNIALRYIDDEARLQRAMAVFTNKADEIAERLDSWAIRERVFTMEHTRWERAVGCTGFDIPLVVDRDEMRTITGTMARFPSFRDTGWKILRSANVVDAEDA